MQSIPCMGQVGVEIQLLLCPLPTKPGMQSPPKGVLFLAGPGQGTSLIFSKVLQSL